MDNNNSNLYDIPAENQCIKCKTYETDIEAYEILLLAISFIGPIIGMLIGLFAAKRFISK